MMKSVINWICCMMTTAGKLDTTGTWLNSCQVSQGC